MGGYFPDGDLHTFTRAHLYKRGAFTGHRLHNAARARTARRAATWARAAGALLPRGCLARVPRETTCVGKHRARMHALATCALRISRIRVRAAQDAR